MSSRRRGGCGGGETQLPTAGAAAALCSGTSEYAAAQVQPLPSDVSAAGYKSLVRSLPRFCSLLSPEGPEPRPKSSGRQQRRRLPRSKAKGSSPAGCGLQNPARESELLRAELRAALLPSSSPHSAPSFAFPAVHMLVGVASRSRCRKAGLSCGLEL